LNYERIESAISDRSINHKYEKNSIRINNYRISIDALFLYFKVNDINTYIYIYRSLKYINVLVNIKKCINFIMGE